MRINNMDTRDKRIEFSEEFKKNKNKLVKKMAFLGTLTFVSVASLLMLNRKDVYAEEIPEIEVLEEPPIITVINQKVEVEPGVFIEIEIPEGYGENYNEESMITLEDNLTVAELIDEYSQIYNVDSSLLYQRAKEITNGFSTPEFVNHNLIKGTTAARQERSFESLKAGILCYVRSVAKNPEIFGFDKDEISTGGSYKFNGCYEEMVEKYCNILGYNPEVIVGIAYTECGEGLDSLAFREKNNSSGTMIGGTITEFDSLDDGVIFTILNLKYNYADFNQLGIEGFANRMGPKYCTEGTDNWKKNFKNFTAKATDNLYYNAHYVEEGISRNI